MKYSHEDMVRRAHSAIFRNDNWCWLTQVVLLGRWVVEDRPGRSNTDGYNVSYTQSRIEELDALDGDKAVRYIVLHENLHKALRHLVTWKGLWKKDPRKANYAMDVVNNNMIAEYPQFATLPPDCVHRPEWAGLSVGEVWDKMEENGEDGTGPNGDQQGDDDHLEYGAAGGGGEDEGDPQPVDAQQLEAIIQSAVSQGLFMQRQKCPDTARKIGALVTPKVDWRKALSAWLSARQWGHDLANWKRRSRRGQALGIHLPTRYQERTGRLVLAVDTSGSIGSTELNAFLSEVGSLANTLQPTQIELLYWGSGIAGHETYLPNEYTTMTSTTRPMDGGGTEIMCVRDWLRQKGNEDVTGVVILTDGYVGSWGEGTWPCPTFVVLNTNASCPLTHVRL